MSRHCAILALAFLVSSTVVVPAQEGVEERIAQLERLGEDTDPEVIRELAESGERTAMEALIAAYPRMHSIYMKREIVRGLAQFSGVEGAQQPALEKLADIAAGSPVRDLRMAAIETLGNIRSDMARSFLKLVVESGADDDVRERAMELHVRDAGPGDVDWYRHIWNPEEDRRKDEDGNWQPLELASIREIAFEGLRKFVGEGELIETVRRTHIHPRVRRAALEGLHAADSPKAPEMAQWLFERVDMPGPDRAAAARILAEHLGADVLPIFLEIAKKGVVTPEDLRLEMARLLREMEDEQVDAKLKKLVGGGSPELKRFALEATAHLDDPKLLGRVRKALEDRSFDVRRTAAAVLAEHRDEAALPALRKLLERPRVPQDLRVALEAIDAIVGDDPDWRQELVELTAHENRDARNAAIDALARVGASAPIELFEERLLHEDWTTRLAAVRALEKSKRKEAVPALIERLEAERGRMRRLVADSLWKLTAKPFDEDIAQWKAWWQREGDDFAVASEEQLREAAAERELRRLKSRTTTEPEFFGIDIVSHRVIFIVDTSGSMSEAVHGRFIDGREAQRIEIAKQELSDAIERLDKGAFFNVLAFSSGIGRWLRSGIADSSNKNRESALEFVDRLGAGGATNLYDTLAEAFEDPDVDTIYLLSDGEPTSGEIMDPHQIREQVEFWNRHRGVKIHTVAIGGNLEILEWLAEDSGGEHVKIR